MAADGRGDLLLTPGEAAERLRVKVGTLAVWRSEKSQDLPYALIGRAVRYRDTDVEAFIVSRTVQGLAGRPKSHR